jgi:hypothetical protein
MLVVATWARTECDADLGRVDSDSFCGAEAMRRHERIRQQHLGIRGMELEAVLVGDHVSECRERGRRCASEHVCRRKAVCAGALFDEAAAGGVHGALVCEPLAVERSSSGREARREHRLSRLLPHGRDGGTILRPIDASLASPDAQRFERHTLLRHDDDDPLRLRGRSRDGDPFERSEADPKNAEDDVAAFRQ